MVRFLFLCLVVVCLVAQTLEAQAVAMVSGGVYEDRASLSLRENFVAAPGVVVRLFRDGGDGLPSTDDALTETTRTDAAGLYVLQPKERGNYWVTVDSKTFPGSNAIAGSVATWPEQTFGPAGSLCSRPDGVSRSIRFEGACFGGRTREADDATSATGAEHVAAVTVAAVTPRLDFAFSYDVVTTTADGEALQGSLRQFVHNANGRKGANAMRFVPVEAPNVRREVLLGIDPRWWLVTLTSQLPPLVDHDTTLSGAAWNFVSPATRTDVHEGNLGQTPTIRPGERIVPRLEKPELEVVLAGSEGIVCTGRCAVRFLAVRGAPTAIVLRTDAVLEHLLVGAAADGDWAPAPGVTGIEIEGGVTVARQLLVAGQTRSGIIVGSGARLDGERLEVTRCGAPQTGGAIILLSNGSSIRNSVITANDGVGILLGSPDGAAPAHGNTIDSCVISSSQSGVVIGPASSRNTILRNDFTWNRTGAIAVAPHAGAPPVENRLSANRFGENGLRPIILQLEGPAISSGCERSASLANNGMKPPAIESVRMGDDETGHRVVLRGRGCPGEIVEFYQSYESSSRGEARVSSGDVPDDQAALSTGEFNYLGATNTRADGTFDAAFPLPLTVVNSTPATGDDSVWADEVLGAGGLGERVFSAIAIDVRGNTSELGAKAR
jgi:hypothetical protein